MRGMVLRATIKFWGDGVSCFCHEAVGRALVQAFPGVLIGHVDLALQKYEGVAAYARLEPSAGKMESSAWNEYLRNGPRYSFELASGAFGTFSRYEIVFNSCESGSDSELESIRNFLESLRPEPISVEYGD